VKVTLGMLWQNWNMERTAKEFVHDQLHVAERAEDLGFDGICCVEHHFDPRYSACPDNFMALTYLAAKTSSIKLALAAVILPWNDPLRVVEKISMLDHMSNGRLIVGFGRGLAQMEYDGFGINMSESRDRYDEAFKMVMNGIRTGVVEGNGKYYKQPRVEVHPKPRPELADSVWTVAMSTDSAVAAAESGTQLSTFTTKSAQEMLPLINGYRNKYREMFNIEPEAPNLVDFMICHPDAAEAKRRAHLYVGRYFDDLMAHYNLSGKHFEKTKGYEQYAEGAKALRETSADAARTAYVEAQGCVGTPDQILERLQDRAKIVGTTNLAISSIYGGMPREMAVENAEMFAKEVLPVLHKMKG
jgi:alkanesulfonate monooxygenase SsuD/methylene tetrahydromethanopterin reductase-like flavin-dependent oxidoreductase (luciferase family)